MNGHVYGIHVEGGDVRYVGITSQALGRRLSQHLRDAANARQTPLSKWIRKHGPESIRIRPLEWHADRDSMNSAEIRLIAEMGTSVADGGLNVCPGGGSTAGHKNFLGKTHSDETKKKLSEGHRARYARTGVSDESRARMSRSRLDGIASGRIKVGGTPESKAIEAIRLLSEGVSQYDIARILGIHQTTVSLIKSGKRHPGLDRSLLD